MCSARSATRTNSSLLVRILRWTVRPGPARPAAAQPTPNQHEHAQPPAPRNAPHKRTRPATRAPHVPARARAHPPPPDPLAGPPWTAQPNTKQTRRAPTRKTTRRDSMEMAGKPKTIPTKAEDTCWKAKMILMRFRSKEGGIAKNMAGVFLACIV